MKLAGMGAIGGAALAALSLVLTPALAASNQQTKRVRSMPSLRAGGFTPAAADPALTAELARRGLTAGSFRFTPALASTGRPGALRVAVRARAARPSVAVRGVAEPSATAVTAVTPSAYNLGASVGWRGFALTGDVAEIKGGTVPGARRHAEVAVSYAAKRLSGRVEVAADKNDGSAARITPVDSAYSVGVGGSYRVARNLDLTGGVRYKIQRDRLEPLADQRRDSQAVYIGTAFRF